MNKLLYTALIIAGVVAIAVADILLKKAAGTGSYVSALKHPLIPVVVLLYLFQVVVFLFVFVKRVDLSAVGVLQTALYAVIVLGAGVLFFNEEISLVKGIGIALALIGVALINISD